MTANAVQGDRERCAAAGMKDFVATPIESEQLWQAQVRSMRPRQGLPVPPSQRLQRCRRWRRGPPCEDWRAIWGLRRCRYGRRAEGGHDQGDALAASPQRSTAWRPASVRWSLSSSTRCPQ